MSLLAILMLGAWITDPQLMKAPFNPLTLSGSMMGFCLMASLSAQIYQAPTARHENPSPGINPAKGGKDVTSIYEQALGSQFQMLHPKIRERFGFDSKDHIASIGEGVMEEIWYAPWVCLSISARCGILCFRIEGKGSRFGLRIMLIVTNGEEKRLLGVAL